MRSTVKNATAEYVQMNLFDMFCAKKAAETEPCLSIGQEVFLLNLDVVRKGKVSRMWLCGEHEANPFYGYSIEIEKGGVDITWDTEIEKRAFLSESEAMSRAAVVEPTLDKLTPQEMVLCEQHSFHYCRSTDAYMLSATIAKVGENRIYKKDYYTYHFLETYPTTKDRDKKYHTFLAKIQQETTDQKGEETEVQILPETMYRSTDTLYASWAYSERNGKPYKK